MATCAPLLVGNSQMRELADASLTYDYKTNGNDWPSISSDCAKENQSPIDLRTDWDVVNADEDSFNKLYTDQESSAKDIKVGWTGDTIKVAVDKAGNSTQTFYSKYAQQNLGGTNKYTGVQFHFHSGSEHTIDGKRFDLEMHTVHVADKEINGVKYAAMGIIFDVNDHTAEFTDEQKKIIDEFFDSLEMNDATGEIKVSEVSYGKLMMMVDNKNRWVYKGSVTTPPCATYVYWNVLREVYPISDKHLQQYLAQLDRVQGLRSTGNWRAIQKLDKQDPKILVYKSAEDDVKIVPLIVMLALALVCFILMILSCVFYKKATPSFSSGYQNHVELPKTEKE